MLLETLIAYLPIAFGTAVFSLAFFLEPSDVVVQQITVPSAVEDQGYPADAIADFFEAKVDQVVADASSQYDPLEIDVATTYASAINTFASYFNLAEPVQATQKLLGRVRYVAEIHIAEGEGSKLAGKLLISAASPTMIVKWQQVDFAADSMDSLLERAATLLMQRTQPYIAAKSLYYEASGSAGRQLAFGETVKYMRDAVPVVPSAERPRLYNLLGKLAERMDDAKLAAEYYRRALFWSPRFSLAHANLGRIYYDLGEYAQAIEHYQASLNADRKLAIAHVYWAEALLAQGRLKAALAQLDAARRLAPEFAQTYEMRAAIYEQVGVPDLAEQELRRAELARIRQPRQTYYDPV